MDGIVSSWSSDLQSSAMWGSREVWAQTHAMESPVAFSMFCVVLPDLFLGNPPNPLGVARHDPRSQLSLIYMLSVPCVGMSAALFSQVHKYKAA